MSNRKDKLISSMVDETMLHVTQSKPVFNLENSIFHTEILELHSFSMEFFWGKKDLNERFFRVVMGPSFIDFPVNWHIFNGADFGVRQCLIDGEDAEELMVIFQEVGVKAKNIYFVLMGEEVLFIPINNQNDLNFCEEIFGDSTEVAKAA